MIPLVLIVGFLGAGKTTLLRRLVTQSQAAGLRPSIVLNDFQNAKVDAELFRDLNAMVQPISGSCVCCGSKEELVEAIAAVEDDEGRVLLVETNGTTDSEELLEFLTAEPRLRKCTLPWQVTVIDTKRWQKRFWHNELERAQATTATHLVLTRLDQVDQGRVEAVRRDLDKNGFTGHQVEAEGLVKELLALRAETPSNQERSLAPNGCGCDHDHHDHDHDHAHGHDHDHAHGHDHHHEHSHHEERHHFASAEFLLPAQVDRKRFESFLHALPDGILRAKGLVRFTEAPTEVQLFQYVDRYDSLHAVPLKEAPTLEAPLLILIGPAASSAGVAEQVAALN